MPTFSERWLSVIQNCKLDLTKPVNFLDMACIEKNSLGWETRKMLSMDTESKRPEIFRQNGSFAISLSTKKVAIVKGKGFETLEEFTEPVQTHKTDFAFPEFLRKSRGEANFLNYAFRCRLFNHFTGRRNLSVEYSAKSRLYCTFRVDGHPPLKVEGAQIELDASYGDEEMFYTVEAKYGARKSFNIRQLYFPFRAYAPVVKPRETKSLYFAYEPNTSEFRFWEYTFRDPDDIEQIELVRRARYKIQFTQNPIPLKEYEVQPVKEMKALQANNVFFLMDVPDLVNDGIDDTWSIAHHFGIHHRQGEYNASGMKILGFIEERGKHKFKLTPMGEDYIKLDPEARTKFFVKKLTENPLVSEALSRILDGETLTLPELKDITERNDPRIKKSTIKRRAECLFAYFKFIAEVMGYCKVENGVISKLSAKETLNGYR